MLNCSLAGFWLLYCNSPIQNNTCNIIFKYQIKCLSRGWLHYISEHQEQTSWPNLLMQYALYEPLSAYQIRVSFTTICTVTHGGETIEIYKNRRKTCRSWFSAMSSQSAFQCNKSYLHKYSDPLLSTLLRHLWQRL